METESRTEQHYAVSKNGMLVHISEAIGIRIISVHIADAV